MKWLALAALGVVGSLVFFSSGTRKLNGHVFAVPAANDIPDSSTPFFLPLPGPGDGFSFCLNPEADLRAQILIGVESKKQICSRAAGSEALVNHTVCAPTMPPWRGVAMRKNRDGVLWRYELPSASGNVAAAPVSCFALADNSGDGLCTARLPYKDLILSIHLRDSRMSALEASYADAVSKLESWER
ncbi:hypothetical protein [Sphingomonas pokkalii]|uniref:hypothetical protein n=1 Tax=Sphingomonas pokkalii TaxID=2175090 RepID=UPI001057B571|nr:hypothetical protein [Sphingomonas pokkalii]